MTNQTGAEFGNNSEFPLLIYCSSRESIVVFVHCSRSAVVCTHCHSPSVASTLAEMLILGHVKCRCNGRPGNFRPFACADVLFLLTAHSACNHGCILTGPTPCLRPSFNAKQYRLPESVLPFHSEFLLTQHLQLRLFPESVCLHC